MLLWFISLLVYIINPIAGEISGYFAWVLLKFDMLVVDFFWNLDYSVYKLDFWIYKQEFFIHYFLVMILLDLYSQKKDKNEQKEAV